MTETLAERLRAQHEAEKKVIKEQQAEQLQRQAEEQRAKLLLEWREVRSLAGYPAFFCL